MFLFTAILLRSHLQRLGACAEVEASGTYFLFKLSLCSPYVTVKCEASSTLFSKNVSDFVRVFQFFTWHSWEMAFVRFTMESLIGRF